MLRQIYFLGIYEIFNINNASMLGSKVQLAPPTKNVIMAVLTPKSFLQLTDFTAFEAGRKLNSVCCNYVHVSHQPLISVTQKRSFPKSTDSHVMHRFIIFVRTNQDITWHMSWYDIDYKCFVKNLLRFFNNNIARGRIDKRSKKFCILDCWNTWLYKNETK